MDRLVGEQQQQFKHLMQRQADGEEHVRVLEERLGTAEEALVSLRSTQEVMTEELHEGHTALRSELLGELQAGLQGLRQQEQGRGTGTRKTTLDASAVEFVPSASALDPSIADSGETKDGDAHSALDPEGCSALRHSMDGRHGRHISHSLRCWLS